MKGAGTTLLYWMPQMEKAFNEIKVALLNAPALATPDVRKPFHLYVDEKGMVKGVLL